MHLLKSILGAALLAAAVPVSAVTITADYSMLGTVYQDASGQFFDSAATGRLDVTNLFKSNVSTGISYLQDAIRIPFSTTITFKQFDLTSSSAVGDSQITGFDANNRPSSSIIRVDNGSIKFFVDPTPADNIEFTLNNTNASLGGGMVNVSRFGNAVANGPADNRWDLLTLVVHEVEHSLGFSDGATLFTDAAGATGSANRSITVPTALTGLPMNFAVPFVSGSAHTDGVVQSGLFNDTVVAEPGFSVSQRALATGAEIYALCVVLACAANEVNPNPMLSSVPEPSQALLFLAGAPVLIWLSRRRKPSRA